jgi:hypothetical protein
MGKTLEFSLQPLINEQKFSEQLKKQKIRGRKKFLVQF